MLQLLQGDITHLPALKNFCKRNTELTKDTPVFAMADAPLILIKGGAIDGVKTKFVNVRWQFFHFWWRIPEIPEMLKFYLNGPTLSRGRGKIAYRPNTFDQDCTFNRGFAYLVVYLSTRLMIHLHFLSNWLLWLICLPWHISIFFLILILLCLALGGIAWNFHQLITLGYWSLFSALNFYFLFVFVFVFLYLFFHFCWCFVLVCCIHFIRCSFCETSEKSEYM